MSLFHSVQALPGTHPVSSPFGAWDWFRGVKRPGREDALLPSSRMVALCPPTPVHLSDIVLLSLVHG
jgi:hypothetical protein